MKIITMELNAMGVNTYLLFEERGQSAVVIDPSAQPVRILETLKYYGVTLTDILLTHGHFDHIGAVAELKAKTNARIHIHPGDADMLIDPEKNLSVFASDRAVTAPPADVLLEDGEQLDAGGLSFKVIHTPGHSPGSVCFLHEDGLFSGDTLFFMSIGRSDLPGGDEALLIRSIRNKLFTLPADYTVYPGHHRGTQLHFERDVNPYVKEKK